MRIEFDENLGIQALLTISASRFLQKIVHYRTLPVFENQLSGITAHDFLSSALETLTAQSVGFGMPID